jgi:hypothetical protein
VYPGVVESELANTISDPIAREPMQSYRNMAIPRGLHDRSGCADGKRAVPMKEPLPPVAVHQSMHGCSDDLAFLRAEGRLVDIGPLFTSAVERATPH